jgi:MFS family permease
MVIENYKSVGICALLHFLVDGLCACCLYLVVWPSTTLDVVSLFIIYNVLAFLTQPLTGWIVDRMHQKHWMLLGSMLLMTLAVALSIFTTYHFLLTTHHLLLTIIPVLLGIANSMFHVWGGQLTAVRTQNDIRSLGIFVSTGAFGLAVGVVFASWPLLLGLLFAYCGVPLLFLLLGGGNTPQPSTSRSAKNFQFSTFRSALPLGSAKNLILLLLILLIVGSRSMISTTFSGAMEKTTVIFLLVGFVSMLGKAAGGFLCKWMGMLWACVLMVVGTAVIYFSLHHSPLTLLPLLGLFLVNCTMPVTLYFANVLLKGREGLAFGLLAAVLMPGYLLATFNFPLGFAAWLSQELSIINSQLSILNYFLLPLLATIVLELGVLWLLKERRAKVLWASVIINIFTNVTLNLILFNGPHPTPALHILVGELTVIVIETLWYFLFVRNWRQAIAYGVLCNAISYLTGLFVQLLYFLIF